LLESTRVTDGQTNGRTESSLLGTSDIFGGFPLYFGIEIQGFASILKDGVVPFSMSNC